MLADVVGAQVSAHRKRRGLTREQLADLVTEHYGWRLTTDVLTNLETRRSKGRAGPRDVTLDEVTTLARALEVPPIMLIFSLGIDETTEIGRPDTAAPTVLPTWDALRWFTGEIKIDGSRVDDDPEAAALVLWRIHQSAVDDYLAAIQIRRNAPPSTGHDAPVRPGDGAVPLTSLTHSVLLSTRAQMRRARLTPPPLPPDLQWIEKDRDA